MAYNQLTPEEERVILYKGTERPFTGELLNNKAEVYTCVNNVMHRYITRPINLNRFAAGQVLMMKFPVPYAVR
jgi:hypothetical protein